MWVASRGEVELGCAGRSVGRDRLRCPAEIAAIVTDFLAET